MIQRKQTLYLLGAIIAYVLCLFFPIGSIAPEGMGLPTSVHCLGLAGGEGGVQFDSTCLPLFILCALSAVLALVTIFMFKNRKLQMNLCVILWLFTDLWYVDYVVVLLGLIGFETQAGHMSFGVAALLPAVGQVLSILAWRGIVHDEQLIRSADRIR